MQIIYKKTSDLIPYENNPRKNDQAVQAVAESIKTFGFKVPVIIDKQNIIICGHTRVKSAELLNMDEVPCILADDLTEEQVTAFRLADNKTGELAEWDFEKLEEELEKIADIDMSSFGFEEMEKTLSELKIVEDDCEVQIPEEPKSKLGDMYRLGKHFLIVGDSTDASVINKLLNGKKAALLLTDPPYGIDVVKGNKVGGGGALLFGKVGGGNWVESKTYSAVIGDDTTDTARENYDAVLPFTENQIIFGGNYFTDFLPPSRCWIVWDKQNTGNYADAELAWTSFDRGVKLYHYLWNGLCREGSREVEGITRVHPTQKPVGMLANILTDFSEEQDTILDCFGGSGSTLIACEQLNRQCFMCELDPHYCDVIIERWEKFTGRKAEKIA